MIIELKEEHHKIILDLLHERMEDLRIGLSMSTRREEEAKHYEAWDELGQLSDQIRDYKAELKKLKKFLKELKKAK